MNMKTMPPDDPRAPVPEPDTARRRFSIAARGYAEVAALQDEVRRRLMSRLDVVKLVPSCVLELGCGPVLGARELSRRYAKARVVAMDYSLEMLRAGRVNVPRFGRVRRVAGDAASLPLANDSVDMVFSNLMLPWCPDLAAVFREIQRVLRPEGVLMFSSLGPDTLKELREAWAQVDALPHVHVFEDMHNVGDALVGARLADPVMDMEYFTLSYSSAEAMMRDLKANGVANSAAGRRRGLTAPGILNRVREVCDTRRDADGRLSATFEVVYGHAWGTAAPGSYLKDDGSVSVPLSRIGRRRG